MTVYGKAYGKKPLRLCLRPWKSKDRFPHSLRPDDCEYVRLKFKARKDNPAYPSLSFRLILRLEKTA
ncbi:MAG: hypothetical protein ACYCOR_20895, partial [Acidobacteriaceae bacterium]